jgi:hypothetical protein
MIKEKKKKERTPDGGCYHWRVLFLGIPQMAINRTPLLGAHPAASDQRGILRLPRGLRKCQALRISWIFTKYM